MILRCPVLLNFIILLVGLGEGVNMPDYEFIDGVGWMRLHPVPATWQEARLRCGLEGDVLATISSAASIDHMKTTMQTLGNIPSVFVDLHITFPHGIFISIDGSLPSEIDMEWAQGEPDNMENDEECLVVTNEGKLADKSCDSVHPYFCLKANETGILKCDTKDKGYMAEKSTGSCYKFHHKPQNWHRASMTCVSERANLAVINSDVEALFLQELFLKQLQAIPSYEGEHTEHAHIGVWDWNENNQWVTIFGDTLVEAGYNSWVQKQDDQPEKEKCGCMSRDALLHDVSCLLELAFICESFAKKI